MFCFFVPKACGIPVPWPGIEPTPPALEGKVLTTGPPGKSPASPFSDDTCLLTLRRWIHSCPDLYGRRVVSLVVETVSYQCPPGPLPEKGVFPLRPDSLHRRAHFVPEERGEDAAGRAPPGWEMGPTRATCQARSRSYYGILSRLSFGLLICQMELKTPTAGLSWLHSG